MLVTGDVRVADVDERGVGTLVAQESDGGGHRLGVRRRVPEFVAIEGELGVNLVADQRAAGRLAA